MYFTLTILLKMRPNPYLDDDGSFARPFSPRELDMDQWPNA